MTGAKDAPITLNRDMSFPRRRESRSQMRKGLLDSRSR